jgi:hypothetical protein
MAQQASQLATPSGAKVLQIDRRTPERQVLFIAINALKASDADLDATRRAVSDDFDTKVTRQHELDELRETAVSMGVVALFEKITRVVESGVEPSVRFDSDEEEQLGTRLKSLLLDVELYTRRRAANETAIPGKERAVGTARHKVREAALAVIRASDAVAMVMNDLEILQNQVTEKRVALRYFISKDLVSPDDAAEVKRLMKVELPPHPMGVTYVNWSAHAAHIKWAAALERLMVDADAELPTA